MELLLLELCVPDTELLSFFALILIRGSLGNNFMPYN